MTTSTESSTLALLDTNILVYAVNSEAQHHSVSKDLLSRASAAGAALCVAPQNLTEFYAIVTDRRRVPKPVSPAEAVQAIKDLLAMPGLALLTVPVDIVNRWTELLQSRSVSSQHAFDVFLVATMLGNGVQRLYTFNVAHFQVFQEIEVHVPQAVAKS